MEEGEGEDASEPQSHIGVLELKVDESAHRNACHNQSSPDMKVFSVSQDSGAYITEH